MLSRAAPLCASLRVLAATRIDADGTMMMASHILFSEILFTLRSPRWACHTSRQCALDDTAGAMIPLPLGSSQCYLNAATCRRRRRSYATPEDIDDEDEDY